MNNIYKNIPSVLKEELFETILENDKFRLERIVSQNHSTPENYVYDQDWWEWVVLLRGNAVLSFVDENKIIELTEGDYVLIEPHKRHRVEKTSENAIWLAIHYK